MFIAIFNSFDEAVCPVGMTTNRFCFMRIIGHKSSTIHRSFTKFKTKIRRWTPFLCTKFQDDRSTCLRFIAIFASARKHKERGKKIETWAARISEMAGAISFKFGM